MEIVSAYKPKCCKKAYLLKGSASRHEKNCAYNPDNKACATCGHCSYESDTVYNPFHGGDPGSTDYEEYYYWCDQHEKVISQYPNGKKPEECLSYQKHCINWISKVGD